MHDLEAENRRLRARIDELEEAERQRKEDFRFVETLIPWEWHLSESQRIVLITMANAPHYTAHRDQLYAALRSKRFEINEVDVVVCKMRPKLQPFGVIIQTVWGIGYRLKPESGQLVKQIIDDNAYKALGLQ